MKPRAEQSEQDRNVGWFLQTIGVYGFLMVFKILRAMVNDGFEVNDGLDVPLNLKSV